VTSRPFFSVILPTYNRAHTLERAIVSVLAQSFQDFEFFIVDDGSTDETQDIISRYQNIYNIQLKTNGGVSAARNTAAKIGERQMVGL
jgi:glycosyltransferase involved in cell wall biosynthesis